MPVSLEEEEKRQRHTHREKSMRRQGGGGSDVTADHGVPRTGGHTRS